jgi:thiol-disulfide isomerase/thioredoxin
MSIPAYDVISVLLATIAQIAVVLILASVIVTVARWRSPKRKRHVMQTLGLLVIATASIGAQQFIQWKILLPLLATEQLELQQTRRVGRDSESSLLRVGDQVPELEMVTITGESIAIPNGKVMLINFFATWCGPCILELPQIEKLYRDRKRDERFGIVVIGRDESVESVRRFLQENKYTFPAVADQGLAIYSRFAKDLIPRTLIVSPTGKITYSSIGFLETDIVQLNHALDELLPPSRTSNAE